jgi:hypothetical protein
MVSGRPPTTNGSIYKAWDEQAIGLTGIVMPSREC